MNLRVQGFLNFDTVRDWLQDAKRHIEKPAVIVDFSEIKGFNSAALAWMIAVKRLGNQRGVDIIWQSVPDTLHQLARVYNLLTILGLSGHE